MIWFWTFEGVMGLDRGQPNYYYLAPFLVLVGTGCAMLAYHALKNNEEDTATKKKIVLVGTAVATPMAIISALYGLDML